MIVKFLMIKKTTTKKLITAISTSIMIATVVSLMMPANTAHATLVGDLVDITLLGADSNNNAESPGVDDVVIVGPELDFFWNDVGCLADDGVSVDIEASTITVNVNPGQGNAFICDTGGTAIDNPLTFTITSLDWVDFPNAVLDDITVTSNVPGFPTTEQVTGDHSVQITVDSINTSGGAVEFTLTKKIIAAEKTWTETDYNWDEVCDGVVNPADGLCFTDNVFSAQLGFRPANINNLGDDVLADTLPVIEDKYQVQAHANKNKFQNTNPGAFYALTTIDVLGDLPNGLTVWENYDDCTDDGDGMLKFVSKKETRNVKVAVAAPNGDVTELTDDLYDGVGGTITADIDSAHVEIDGPILADSTVYVLVKFNDNLKNEPAPSNEFMDMCDNSERVLAGPDDITVNAQLRITTTPLP